MFVVAQTCRHRYASLDCRTDARRCLICAQPEYWRTDLMLWVDGSGLPCSTDPGPAPPPRAA